MFEYLHLIPFGIIYGFLFWLAMPRIEGRELKFAVAVLLIPIAFYLTGFVDSYLPRFLYNFSRWFQNTF
jgi:hypothetical protein